MNSSNTGPKPLFDKAQVRRALELISEFQPIGRKKLADKLGVGEGSVRTILNRLKEEGFVSSTIQGHVLTEKGENELGDSVRKFLEIKVSDLTVGEVDVATIVENSADKVSSGIEERDEAIKVGAEGATVLVFKDNELKLPNAELNIDEEIKSQLLDFFQPEEGDVVIIATADNEYSAERGALAAAESLSS